MMVQPRLFIQFDLRTVWGESLDVDVATVRDAGPRGETRPAYGVGSCAHIARPPDVFDELLFEFFA